MDRISTVVDASALLSLLFRERGADRFLALAGSRPAMSAVNWSEVAQKARAHGIDAAEVKAGVVDAGLEIVDLTAERAQRVAELWPLTRSIGSSLADRACMALALELERPAVTADRSWSALAVPDLEVLALR